MIDLVLIVVVVTVGQKYAEKLNLILIGLAEHFVDHFSHIQTLNYYSLKGKFSSGREGALASKIQLRFQIKNNYQK